MNEAVDRVIEQREALDRGFPAGVVLSTAFHLLLAGAAFGAAWLGPRKPLVRIADGIAVPLPPGGGGPVEPAPPARTPAAPEAPPPAPEPPPKVLKPPKEEKRQGLPPPEARKARPRPERKAPPARPPAPPAGDRRPQAAGGTGTSSTTPGLGLIGPAGPGVPYGTDPMGDWYLAGVQRKIWLIWVRQVKSGFAQPIRVAFTILGDGSLEEGSVQVTQASGVQLLDLAAQRAVYSAAPFAPLPKAYGTNRITIQALFQPTP